MINKRVLKDKQSLVLGCRISTPGTRSIKENIYVKIRVSLWQNSLHVSHLGPAAGYVGPSYKTIFYSLILVKRDGAYLRNYFLISELPESSVLYGFS